MSVFSRMTDIVNSNINALLDKAEDPEKMVRLIIGEMEETLVEVRSTSARAIADRKELTRRHGQLREEASEWERKAELALSKDREDLARAALVEKSKAEEVAESMAADIDVLDGTLAKLNGDIGALQNKIKDAKARQNAIIMRGKAVKVRLGVRRQLSDHNIDNAMLRFEQYERKMDDLEGQIESYDLGKRTLNDEIEQLEADEAVDKELKRLRDRVRATRPRTTKASGGVQPGE